MRAAAAVLGVILGLALVAALGYVLAPRLLPGARAPAVMPTPDGTTASASGPPHPGEALPSPLSADERLRQELRLKRVPFFRYLRRDWSAQVARAAVLQDLDTLDLVVYRDDDEMLQSIVSGAVAPSAREYGFRRARFLVPAPSGTPEPYVVTAEATPDADGRWTIYRK